MYYPIAIEPGDDKHAFGVVIPDLPGRFSAGDSLEEAMAQARGETCSGLSGACGIGDEGSGLKLQLRREPLQEPVLKLNRLRALVGALLWPIPGDKP